MEWMQYFLAVFVFTFVRGQDTTVGESGLVASTFPDYFSYAELLTYKGDVPSMIKNSPRSNSYSFTDFPEPLITSLAVDVANRSLYYLEVQSRTVKRFNNFNMDVNVTGTVMDEVLHEGISRTLGAITFDWVSGNFYWTDGYFNWIGIQPAFTNDTNLFRALLDDGLTVPLGIAVDPINGYLFWSDLKPSPRIERSTLTGESRSTIVTRGCKYPNALAVDIPERRVYWADSVLGTLESDSYLGLDRRKLVTLNGYTFGALVVYNDHICFTEQGYGYLICHDKKGVEVWDDYQYGEPWGITVFDKNVQQQKTDNCPAKGCSDMCINTDTGAKCICREGYDLNNDGISCTATHALTKKGIMFINGTYICVLDIRAINTDIHTPQCIVANITGAKYVQADTRKGWIYYWDSISKILKRYNLVSGVLTNVTNVKTGNVTGLFYDWIDEGLYWTENDTQRINMIDLKQLSPSIRIVINNVKNVGYITANPHKYVLYWISGDNPSSMVIESSSMDGSNRLVLVQTKDLTKPTGLYYDEVYDQIYWIDSRSLKMKSAKGDGEVTTELSSIGNARDLLLYKDYALWTSGTEDIFVAALTASAAHKSINITDHNNVTGMCIFDKRIQTMTKGPCQDSNGGCQHICVPTSQGPACHCDVGFKLHSDRKSCRSEPLTDNFLLLADFSNNMIYQVPTDRSDMIKASDIVAVNVSLFQDPVGVAYEPTSGFLYWTELYSHRLRRGKLNGENVTTLKVFVNHYPDRLIFDQSTENLYFTATRDYYANPYSDETSYIGVLELKHDPVHPKLKILVTDLDDPRCLAVYPQKGYVFFGEAGYPSYIGRVNMDGTKQIDIASRFYADTPLGISVDYINDMVYWADYSDESIWRVDIDGKTTPEKFYTEKGSKMADMVMYGSDIYFIGWNLGKVIKINKSSQKEVDPSFMADIPYFGRIDNLVIYPGDLQPVSRYCYSQTDPRYNGRCSTFCLPTPGNKTCACEEGIKLVDGNNCENVCSMKLPNGMIKDCTIYPGAMCDYKCDKLYEKNPRIQNIKCLTNTSWSVPEHQLCIEKTCKSTISNGRFTGACAAKIGNTCTFECNNGHKAKKYQYPTVVCYAHTDGQVRWNVDVDTICEKEVTCKAEISNGKQSCINPTAGSECQVQCNSGYFPFSKSEKLVCLSNGDWSENLDHICRPLQPCPVVIDNGQFTGGCKGNTYEKCSFTCNKDYVSLFDVDITCLSTGKWSIPTNTLCTKPEVSKTGASTAQDSSKTIGGVLGGILGLLIIIIIIGAVCYFTRRQEMRSAVYKNEPNVYFNNPPVDERSYNQFNQPTDSRYHQFSNPMTETESAYDMISEKSGGSKPQEQGPATYYLRDVEERKLDTSLKVKGGGNQANLTPSMEDQNSANKALELK